jgi:hypothetical protein
VTAWIGECKRKAARCVCEAVIFDESIIVFLLLNLLLLVVGLGEFDDSLLFVVELLPQTRLRDRDVDEVQIQLRHGSPDLDQMLSVHCQGGVAAMHQRGRGGEVSPRVTPRVVDSVKELLAFRNPSMLPESATYFRPAGSGRTKAGLDDRHAARPLVTVLQTHDVDE